VSYCSLPEQSLSDGLMLSKRSSILTILLVCAFTGSAVEAMRCLLSSTKDEPRQPSPKLVTDTTLIDFGNVYTDTTQTTALTLRNLGDAALVVRDVETGCGCTTTDRPSSPLAPGDSVVVEIKVELSGQTGPFARQVRIISNDPRQPSIAVEVRANVCPLFAISPNPLVFPNMLEGETRSQEISVATAHGLRWTATAMKSHEQGPDVFLRGAVDKGVPPTTSRLIVNVTPRNPGKFVEVIRIESRDDAGNLRGRAIVPILVETAAVLSATPGTLCFYRSEDGYARRLVRLQANASPPNSLEIRSLEYDKDMFEIVVTHDVKSLAAILYVQPRNVYRHNSRMASKSITVHGRVDGKEGTAVIRAMLLQDLEGTHSPNLTEAPDPNSR
jgi:hypothetical protein